MREIETQPVRCDQRAFLHHVRTENLAQSRVHQVRGGMVEHNRLSAFRVYLRSHRITNVQASFPQPTQMQMSLPMFLRVADFEPGVLAAQPAGVADLSA